MQTEICQTMIEAKRLLAHAPDHEIGGSLSGLRTAQSALSQFDSSQGQLSRDLSSLALLLAVTSSTFQVSVETRKRPQTPSSFPSSATIDQLQAASPPVVPTRTSAWDILESLAGTVDAPADWSLEHDHYLYGTPRRH